MKTFETYPVAVRKRKTESFNPDLARKFQEAGRKRLGIEDFIHDYLCKYISDRTKESYEADLGFFFEFLKSGGVSIAHPAQLEAYHFQLYRDHLIDRKLASATINRKLVSIRSFVKWAVSAQLMTHNPLDTIKLPKVQTVSPTVAFDDIEAVRMINAPDLTTHKGRRDRLAMVLLFNLGLRRDELVNLKLKDFVEDRGHKVVRIKGKGDKIRIIPLNDMVQSEVRRYLDGLTARSFFLEEDDYLLQTSDRRAYKNIIPMDGSTVYRVIQNYANVLGIDKRVSPHSCRATVISHLLDTQGESIRAVATFAGHSNITTTERYDKRRDNLDKSSAYAVNYDEEIQEA